MTHTNTTETGRERLERLRAEVAEMDRRAEAAKALAMTPVLPEPGSVVHCLVTGTTISTGQGWLAGGIVLNRGQNIVITTAMLEATRNAGGRYTGVALVNHPEAQLARHGRILFAPGEAPDDMVPEHGTAEWRMARETARQAAWSESDPGRRNAALKEVERRYGPAPTTSTVLSTAPDPTIAAAAAQRARLDAGGLKFHMDYSAQEPGVKR